MSLSGGEGLNTDVAALQVLQTKYFHKNVRATTLWDFHHFHSLSLRNSKVALLHVGGEELTKGDNINNYM